MRCILFNKPFRVLTQFTDARGRATLRDHVAERGVYAAGRLDYDSEGLVLLTDDGAVQARVSNPRFHLPKKYWVQVEGVVESAALNRLCKGVRLSGGMARALEARAMDEPTNLWPRDPPIRYRAKIPVSWLELTIDEGRNRQVRHMTAAVGLPTLRLIRAAIGPWTLDGLSTGQCRALSADEVDRALRRAPPTRFRPSNKNRRGSRP